MIRQSLRVRRSSTHRNHSISVFLKRYSLIYTQSNLLSPPLGGYLGAGSGGPSETALLFAPNINMATPMNILQGLSETSPYIAPIITAGYYGARGIYDSYRKRMARRYKGKRKYAMKPKYRKRRRKFRRRTKKAVGTMQKLRKKVTSLARKVDTGTGKYSGRNWLVISDGTIINTSKFNLLPFALSKGSIEGALSELKYYDPSNPATLLTADGTDGAFRKEFYFTKFVTSGIFKNNSNVPVNIKVYVMHPKLDTSITPVDAFTTGLADVGSPSSTAINVYPTDSNVLTTLWRTSKTITRMIQPGGQLKVSHAAKPFKYDPAFFSDAHNLEYQRAFQATVITYRLAGQIGHKPDDITDLGFLATGLDILTSISFTVTYDAGADIETVKLASLTTLGTNDGVTGVRAVSNNQAFDIS